MRLAKYLTSFKLGWQNQLEYRMNNLIFLLIAAVSLISVFYLWNDVFRDRAALAGYDRAEIVTYYVLISFLFASINRFVNVASTIRSGNLSAQLVKPFHYLWYVYWISLAERLFRLAAGLPLLLAIFFIWRRDLSFVTDPRAYLVLGLTVLGSINILFLTDVLANLMEFWMKDGDIIKSILDTVVGFFAGTLIPLVLLPPVTQRIGDLLPFKYAGAFIVEAFLGKLTSGQILQGLALQTIWTAALAGLVAVVWRRGLRRYEAFGA